MTASIDANRTLKEIKGAASYSRSVRAAIYALWSGKTDLQGFFDMMSTAIERGFNLAWEEGASECGISREEWTVAEFAELRYQVASDINYLMNFALDIEQGSKANGGKLGVQYTRAELWVNRYWAIVSLARTMACADQKLLWVFGDTIRHCNDCSTYEGRVYRASIWDKYGIRPGLHTLACGGWRCHCELTQTDLPVTPGRPPSIKGI